MNEIEGLILNIEVLDKLIDELEDKAAEIIKRIAIKVQQQAQELAPLKTGALKNSLLAEEKDGKLSWWVHDGVEYGIYQELGTSRFAAHPFLTPAVESLREEFEESFKEIFE